jgi:hypothetical protein
MGIFPIGVGSASWRDPTPLIFYLIARCSWDFCTCGRWGARLCVPSRGNSFARSGRRIVEYSDCVCYGRRREAVSPGVRFHGVKLRHSSLFVHVSCFWKSSFYGPCWGLYRFALWRIHALHRWISMTFAVRGSGSFCALHGTALLRGAATVSAIAGTCFPTDL